MNPTEFELIYNTFKNHFESYLKKQMIGISNSVLSKAISYSLYAPGKRIRPVLLLMTLDSLNVPFESGLAAAAAVEMVHTYSLIHDDLPAMDNDDLRRGQPSNHIKFNEATAILAGDSLLTEAFYVATQSPEVSVEKQIQMIRLLSQCAGANGMCEGQHKDLQGENKKLTLKELESIHQLKTGKLFEYCTIAAGIIAESSAEEITYLKDYAQKLGLAFQIRDDLLDVVGTEELLGKNVGTDREAGKNTYPQLLGLEGAYEYLENTLEKARQCVIDLEMSNKKFKKDLLLHFIELLELERG